jgi:hypothetical protein
MPKAGIDTKPTMTTGNKQRAATSCEGDKLACINLSQLLEHTSEQDCSHRNLYHDCVQIPFAGNGQF